MKQWKLWKSNEQARAKKAEQAQRLKKQRAAEESDRAGAESTWEANFNPDAPQSDFSFAGLSYDAKSLESELKELTTWTSTPKWAVEAIKRGIAVHHSGMNKRYRDLVEA